MSALRRASALAARRVGSSTGARGVRTSSAANAGMGPAVEPTEAPTSPVRGDARDARTRAGGGGCGRGCGRARAGAVDGGWGGRERAIARAARGCPTGGDRTRGGEGADVIARGRVDAGGD